MGFEKITRPAPHRKEDPLGDMQDEFTEFITGKHHFTSEELRSAYELLLENREAKSADPAMTTLLTEMQRLERAGFPLNRFAEAVGTLQEIEAAFPKYYSYVESLPVSAKEKEMLCSIVKEKRTGTLEVKVEGRDLAAIHLDRIDPGMIEIELLQALQKVMQLIEKGKGKNVEFVLVQ